MDIPLNVPVLCRDGQGGRSTQLIMNPITKEITHLVVREVGLLGIEVIVPIAYITESTPRSITLRCTQAELAAMQPFQESHYLPPAVGNDAFLYMGSTIALWPLVSLDPKLMPQTTEHIPFGELAIRRGAQVHARDGQVGKVDEFVVDPDNHITHLVMREGHLWGQKDVTIPVGHIDRFEDNSVYLKLDRGKLQYCQRSPYAVNRHIQGDS